jgi:hypothetical protein
MRPRRVYGSAVTDGKLEADRVIGWAIVELMAECGVGEDMLIEAASKSGRLVQAVAAHYIVAQSLEAP